LLAGPLDEGVTMAAFSPDGTKIVTASGGFGTAKIWATATGELLVTLSVGDGDGIVTAAFSPDGASVVTGGSYGTVHIWRV